MSKNIVILFDGTSNDISADRTNILRLFGTLKRSAEQIVYYDPGVGTFGAANAWSRFYRKSLEVWGLATGWGLDQNVKEAYRFLVENYDQGPADADGRHPDRDRIYIFGFSRGAYSARVLAGFIHAFGLTTRYHLNLLDYAYRTYKGIPDQEESGGNAAGEGESPSAFLSMRLYERMLRNDRPPIRLLGLFDTVASVIEPGKWHPQFKTHPFTRKNPSVEFVRHAVAIDERRTMFQPELWTPGQEYWGSPFKPKTPAPQDFKEVWFAGVHGDVGGGYAEEESGQIKIPLDWMIRETEPAGLVYVTRTINNIVLGRNDNKYVPLEPLASLHDSMTIGWKILEYAPRSVPETSWRKRGHRGRFYIPLGDRRLVPEGAMIHETVRARMNAGGYNPPNLPDNPQFVA
ncbi:T6SS phospholipase effector Tle1-like catalytic domain-containing protein [Neorhizobium petrolearium]|uniref:T6SS phospholipase effector Tle1-like catalytic domain-containing protein n=1 Tax=Neorhizobium petrolearium TaxID=515361 RepID=UPI003F7ED2DE